MCWCTKASNWPSSKPKAPSWKSGEGVAQAKQYAEKMALDTTYATNGKEIYSICMKTGVEGLVEQYLSPEALWNKTFAIPAKRSLAGKICRRSV